MTILLIDDDPYWSKGFREYAALFEGWDVIYAASPQEGIDVLRQCMYTIDAVLVDIMMGADDSVPEARKGGGLDTGLLLLDSLLPMTQGRVPIILLSARQDVDERAYEGRAQVLLQKNFPTKRIIEDIKNILSS